MVFKKRTIKSTLTVGQRLKRSRERQDLSLQQAESQTLVRAKYLQALEADNWQTIPGKVYLQGYLQRYGDYLGLDGQSLVDQFAKEFDVWSNANAQNARTLGLHKMHKTKFVITPKVLAITLVSLIVTAMTGYIGWQVHRLTAKPTLVIIAPADEVAWPHSELDIIGRTSAGAVVLINNQNVNQDEKGNFRQTILLQDGLNSIEIVAKSRFNKQTSKVIKVLKTEGERTI